MGNDFRLGGIGRKAVGGKDGAVIRGVGLTKFDRHYERVVEVGKRRIRVECTRVEDGLGGRGDYLARMIYVAFAAGSFGD